MTACAVRGCPNRTEDQRKSKKRITFHKFPREPWRREAWMKAIGRIEWLQDFKICSKHFAEEHIDRTSLCVVRLRDNAIPTILPGNGKKRRTKQSRKVDLDYRPAKSIRQNLDKKPKANAEESLVESLWHSSHPELHDPLDGDALCRNQTSITKQEEKKVQRNLEPCNFMRVKNEPGNFSFKNERDHANSKDDVIPFLQ